jgi:hypothetical protein
MSVDVEHVCIHAGDAYGVHEDHNDRPVHSQVVAMGGARDAQVVAEIQWRVRQGVGGSIDRHVKAPNIVVLVLGKTR